MSNFNASLGERLPSLPSPSFAKSARLDALMPEFVGPSKFRQGALFWHLFGFSVIPIAPNTKATAVKWDPWLAKLSHSSIRQYWTAHPDHEVGFIVGDEYIVFDADSQAAVNVLIAVENAFRIRPLLVVQTKRGAHHYFRKEVGLACKTTVQIVGDAEDRIDIKTGRTMVLLPPSTGKHLIQFGGCHA